MSWYGYDLFEATCRVRDMQREEEIASIKPLKHEFRRKLIEELKASGLDIVERVAADDSGRIVEDAKE